MEAVLRWGTTFLALFMATPYAALGLASLYPDAITEANVLRYAIGFLAGAASVAICRHFNESK